MTAVCQSWRMQTCACACTWQVCVWAVRINEHLCLHVAGGGLRPGRPATFCCLQLRLCMESRGCPGCAAAPCNVAVLNGTRQTALQASLLHMQAQPASQGDVGALSRSTALPTAPAAGGWSAGARFMRQVWGCVLRVAARDLRTAFGLACIDMLPPRHGHVAAKFGPVLPTAALGCAICR